MFYQTYQLYMGGREVTRGAAGKRGANQPGPDGIAYRNTLLMPFCLKLQKTTSIDLMNTGFIQITFINWTSRAGYSTM